MISSEILVFQLARFADCTATIQSQLEYDNLSPICRKKHRHHQYRLLHHGAALRPCASPSCSLCPCRLAQVGRCERDSNLFPRGVWVKELWGWASTASAKQQQPASSSLCSKSCMVRPARSANVEKFSKL